MTEKLSSTAARKSEVTIISGFLGAGKTTLLKKILSWESDLSETVVLVNEFGEVGIDGSLLKNAGSDVVELTGGCICCTIKVDLNLTLKKIWQEFKPRQIFIESTGVADPVMIIDVFNEAELRNQMQVSKVVTVLDLELWEARECFGPIFFNQLKRADLILLNKIDLANEDKISQYLTEIHDMLPHSQVVPTVHCAVEPDIVLAGQTTNLELSDYNELNHHPDHDHELSRENRYGHEDAEFPYISFSFRSHEVLDEECFSRFTVNMPWELFRMKGPVRFRDRTVLVNYVGGKNEIAVWNGPAETCLVFVGWNVSGDEIIQDLKNCIRKKES